MTLMHFLLAAVSAYLALSLIMIGAWWAQRRTGNTGWNDVSWSFGVGATAFVAALIPVAPGSQPRQILVASLVGIWSSRLGSHILFRTRAVGDDPRYRAMIRQWGDSADSKMFWHLQIQAFFGPLLALCVILAAQNPNPNLRIQDFLGAAILLLGIGGESIADGQLRRFKSSPGNTNGICEIGLWKWSRHPNYFFEWLVWCAYPVIAIDFSGYNPLGAMALFAPLCMFWLLNFVSGIPPLEQHMLRTRGDVFRAYRDRTSAFFPWPPARVTNDDSRH